MANYETLKSSIQAVIKQNGNKEITGDLLQQSLLAMINLLGAGYQFAGIAGLDTDPGTPDARVFYVSGGPGLYTNFGGSNYVPVGYLGIFIYSSSWTFRAIRLGDNSIKWNENVYIKNTDGSLVSLSGWSSTDLIELSDGISNYFLSVRVTGGNTCAAAFYDKDLNFVGIIGSGFYNKVRFQPPATAKYIRICRQDSTEQPTLPTLMPEYNSSKEQEIIVGKNDWKENTYISNTDGSEVTNTQWYCTGFIPVFNSIDRAYFLSVGTSGTATCSVAYYDSNKQYLGYLDAATYTLHKLQFPAGTAYIRIVKRLIDAQPDYDPLLLLINTDETPTDGSTLPVQSGGVFSALSNMRGRTKKYLLYDAIRDNSKLSLTGWSLTGGKLVCSSTGIENIALINAEYFCSRREIIYDFKFVSGIMYFYTKSWSNANSSLVSVDFTTNKLNLHEHVSDSTIPDIVESVSFVPSVYGTDYRVVLSCPERGAISAKLYDITSGELLAEIVKPFQYGGPSWGLLFERPAVFSSVSGAIVTRFQVVAEYSDNILVQIIGDSITQGYYASGPRTSYAGRLIGAFGGDNVVLSGRSGGRVADVLEILESETPILKPKYVMVTIGTNAGITQQNATDIINGIVAAGAIPILNHIPSIHGTTQTLAQANAVIDTAISASQNRVYCAKMDVGVSEDFDPAQGIDTTCFVTDQLHPNDKGHLRMYERIKTDIPEIF